MDKKLEKALRGVYKRNSKTITDEGIDALAHLYWWLEDHFSHANGKALLSKLTAGDAEIIRKYALGHCCVGMDRTPACLEIVMQFDSSTVWLPQGEKISAVLDRMKKVAEFSYDDRNGNPTIKTVPVPDDLEDKLFYEAASQIRCEGDSITNYAMDGNKMHIECRYADDIVCTYDGAALEDRDHDDYGINAAARIFNGIMDLFRDNTHDYPSDIMPV